MDLENTSDQYSARDLTNNGIETAQMMADALTEMLNKLKELGLDKDQEITVMLGSRKIYNGTIDGEGTRQDLTEAQAKTLSQALTHPDANSGSVRILDADKNLVFQSKKGQILKNDLHQLLPKETNQQTTSDGSGNPGTDAQDSAQVEEKPQGLAQSPDIPSLDDAPAEGLTPEPTPDTSTVDLSESEVQVLEVASSELSEILETEKLAPDTQVSFKQGDPLEELGQIAVSQAVQIAELQAQLSEVNGKLDELTQWKENVTPVKLANERLGNWMNQQRDNVANKIHGFANKIASSATQKFEEVQSQVKEKVDQGVERHSEAVASVKSQVSDKIGEVRGSVENKVSQAHARHERAMNKTLGKAGRKAAESFMSKFVEPATKMLVHQMDSIGEVTTQLDGTKTFETDKIDWHVRPDGSTMLTRKETGEPLKPKNVTVGEMDMINTAVQVVNKNYGLELNQAQKQAQAPTQAPVPTAKPVQKM